MADKLLKSITFPDLTDKYIVGDTTLSVAGAGADAKATGDALATKANIDGSYEDLTAGTANQINTSVRANDKTPYIFRTSGGSVDIGDREYVNGIVGGTVAWNQKRHESINTVTTDGITTSYSNGKFSITNNSRTSNYGSGSTRGEIGDTAVQGHKYIAFGNSNKSIAGVTVSYNNSGNLQQVFNINTVFSVGDVSATLPNFYLRITSGYDFVTTHPIDDVTEFTLNIIDLTQMFGSTIADYIYSLETANAGAGVAWFKKLFPKAYYPYDAGSLKSVEGLTSHDMVGFNALDKSTITHGYKILSGGSTVYADATRAYSDYFKVIPNTTYYISANWETGLNVVFFYDENKNYVLQASNNTHIYTTPANCVYARLNLSEAEVETACMNIAWDGSRNGEYEPYVKHSYPLDSDLTLRGIPKLDANNNLYYDGDVYEADGTVTRKYGVVDLGTLSWSYETVSATPRFYAGNLPEKSANKGYWIVNSLISNSYARSYNVGQSAGQDKMYGIVSNSKSVYVVDSAYTDATSFKTAMNGVYLVYELATPTTETADPYVSPQIVDDFGTEEWVLSDSVFPCPVGSDVDYPINMVAKLEMAPNSPSGDGDYIVRQVNGENSYVPLVIEDALPTIPSTAGSYKLTVTVAEGSDPVLSWEAE